MNEEVNIQKYMEVLVSNVKELFHSEVSSVKEQIKSLEDKMVTQLSNHEKESENQIKQFEEEIVYLKNKVNKIDKRVEELELKPVQTKAGWIDKFGGILQKVIFTAIASGIVALLIFLITEYTKTL